MPSAFASTLIRHIKESKEFFDRSTRVLEEEDSAFVPSPGMLTVAQQVAHVAQTIDWFRDGITRPEGLDMNFEAHMAEVGKVTSLKAARDWFQKATDALTQKLSGMSDADLHAPLPDGPIMGGAPKHVIIGAINDHNAHHRGALTVYSRMLRKVPAMPYYGYVIAERGPFFSCSCS